MVFILGVNIKYVGVSILLYHYMAATLVRGLNECKFCDSESPCGLTCYYVNTYDLLLSIIIINLCYGKLFRDRWELSHSENVT